MYNRYIRNDNGTYTRIREEDHTDRAGTPHQESPPPRERVSDSESAPRHAEGRASDGLTGFLRHILDQFHLDSIDTGDLILLGLLFFLSRENADEELLIALGLLLIL